VIRTGLHGLAIGPRSRIVLLSAENATTITSARMTYNYVRHGTWSLLAAFNIGSGSMISQYYRRRRHQEFLRSPELIDDAVPHDLDLHLVLDNYATH
jgi:hypothetical protein